MKFCKGCGKEKNIIEFYKRPDGSCLTPCKQCKLKYEKRKWLLDRNIPEKKAKQKEYKNRYYQNNKEKCLRNTARYYNENRSYYQQYQKEYEKTHPRKLRKKSLPSVKDNIRSNISRSISRRIASFGGIKNCSIIKYLSFSFKELVIHLEKQFEEWMNWDNYGKYDPKTWDDDNILTWKWQIDHIIPHSCFKYTSMEDEDFKKCWKLDNLRPYSAKQNILDSNRRKGV